ncbi:hypothetical protein F5972_08125 [Microbispora cellulosiformans]|uniref:Uncharacterized protein n=1 Tax=Microbispora cellulosiformans TaxID=2614688 RepID=A0A5J5K828_9ACTN|nr:hypothetical protein [Microbispora cellulosiformans]KAA9379613.1 hypothetical protein F5972_08125 [Microbispora cellulosiformans]
MSTRGSYTAPAARVERARGVTDANGLVTFTWPAGAFSAPPVVTHAIEAGTVGVRTARITANTAAATTMQVLVTTGVTVLGISVLGPGVPASGVTVHSIAVSQ